MGFNGAYIELVHGDYKPTLLDDLPSGKHTTKTCGTSLFLVGRSTVNVAIFNSFLYVYWRVDFTLIHHGKVGLSPSIFTTN